MAEEREPGEEEIDLSPLEDLRGVQKRLHELASKRQVGDEEIIGVLRSELESFERPETAGRFQAKAESLRTIIGWVEEGRLGARQILDAVEFLRKEKK